MTLNYLGKYDNLSLLWEAHPNGGIEGEYCYVGDQLFVWDKYENDWVEGSAEALDVVPSEQPERESNNGLNCIGCFESEQQLWSQHPQGGVEGDYVVIAGKEYIWDKYNKEWREATEEDAAHFTAVIVQDEAYEYSRLAITFMGSFEDVSQIWKVYPQGGIEGGYIYLGEDKYIWDKYSYSWKPFEPTESSKLRPIDVTYTEGVVAYSEDYINYIGTFDNLDQVWEMYPNGGKDGDYILVNGERLKWNKYTSNWGEDESGDTSPARSVATIYGDLHVFNDLVIGEGLYARILEELSKKQWVQDNFTTKQWLLDQNYARQEWVLDQYKVLQDWVDQRNADIAKWILERNYISEGDISSETVMNLIETDEITITKKDGVLVAIASGGQGSVPIITTKDVDAIPSDQNVFSAAKVVATFLDTTKGGTVHESVNFEKGIRIGGKDGIEIIYDIENNALCFGGNAYSLGGMTAGGVGSGGSGGGGISYNRLDSWSDYSADKSGWVLSALLGNDLNTRLISVENAGYVTASALAPYALRSEIPSLEGYATLDALNTLSQTVVNFKSLFDSMFEKDSDGNIHAKLSLWSSGGMTAGGVGSGGSGGGGISYNRLDSWSDYSADKSGWVLSALLGNDLNTRLISVENAGYVTQSALAPYALRSEIPSLTGYATQSWVLSQQYLTSISRSMVTDALGVTLGYVIGRISIPLIGLSGVMEIGKYIDFHTLDEGDGVDYSLRIECQGAYGNRVYFPTTTGTLALTSNIPTKLSQLTDDVVAGKYLPLSGGTLSGSNRDLLNLDTLNTSGPRITLNENGNLIALIGCVPKQTTTDYGAYFVNVSSKFGVILGNDKKAYITLNTDTMSKDYQILHSGNYSDYALSKYGGTVNGSITATSFIGNLTGNADSATKLATPRTIWGQRFDGTGDITGALIGDTWRILKEQAHDGIFIQSKNYEGTSDLGNIFITAWNGNSLSSFNVWANKSIFSGNVAIGGTTTSEKLHIYGNTLISGGNNPYLVIEDNLNRQWYFQYYDNHISIGTSYSNGVKIDSAGNLLTAGSLTSQAIASAGISIGCDASGVASDNYAREINTFANKLYLQYRGGDLDLCGGGGTTYIGGALDGKTANFTSLTAPSITANSLTIGGATITYDSVNEALCVNGNMYALGGITAGGAGISAYTSLEARVARLEQQLNIS